MPQSPFPIPASELAAVAADFATAMDQTVKIERPTNSKGVWGETLESWTTISAATACILDEPSGTMLERFIEFIADKITWRVLLPAGTNIARNDRLTLASTGEKLRVEAVDSPKSYEVLVSVLATEVRSGG